MTKTEIFIQKAKKVYKNKYNYSLVNYINNRTKVKIIDKQHGIFEQTPVSHLQNVDYFYSLNLFLKKAIKIHGNKYDYSKIKNIKNFKEKIKIKCNICDNYFEQKIRTHLQSSGCTICNDNMKLCNNSFIKKAKKVHGDLYDYSLVKYKNCKTKVEIICLEHGIFKQRANGHLKGYGCPICNESKGEKTINDFLKKKNIKFKREMKFEDCVGKKQRLPFDFYLSDYNICIEFDGKQHFEANKHFGGENRLKEQKKTDQIKNNFCKKNKIKLFRIRYDEDISEKLEELFFFVK